MNNITLLMTAGNVAFWLFNATVPPRICLRILDRKPPEPGSRFFRVRTLELSFYRLLGIRWWKDRLPVMAGTLNRKNLSKNISQDYLCQMITATCSTEVIHLTCGAVGYLSIGFVLLLPAPLSYVPLFTVIATANLLAQIPFVAAQRYNRARFMRVLGRLQLQGLDRGAINGRGRCKP